MADPARFLPLTVGDDMVDDVLDERPQVLHWRNDPFIPVEFSVAAYRFGHSQVRPSYRANFGTSATDLTQQFFALIFDPRPDRRPTRATCGAGCRAPRRFIDWQTFFDFGDGRVSRNKRIDTTLSTVLFHLLGQPTGEPDIAGDPEPDPQPDHEVPSGQRVAKRCNVPPLALADLADLCRPRPPPAARPLWFYVLREAEGQRRPAPRRRSAAGSSPRSSGLIQGDPSSYLRRSRTGRRRTGLTTPLP